jgi:hypothetical protein
LPRRFSFAVMIEVPIRAFGIWNIGCKSAGITINVNCFDSDITNQEERNE